VRNGSNIEAGIFYDGCVACFNEHSFPSRLAHVVCGRRWAIPVGGVPRFRYLGNRARLLFSYELCPVVPLFSLWRLATRSGTAEFILKTLQYVDCERQARRSCYGGRKAGCAAFGAICGSFLGATASQWGKSRYLKMKRLTITGSLQRSALAAGGTLGILIPPS